MLLILMWGPIAAKLFLSSFANFLPSKISHMVLPKNSSLFKQK